MCVPNRFVNAAMMMLTCRPARQRQRGRADDGVGTFPGTSVAPRSWPVHETTTWEVTMSDRDKRKRQKEQEPKGGAPRRSGLGDDQGTRIGTPDPGGREATGPSSQTTGEGLEGSALEDDTAPTERPRRSTGTGAEAARSAHAFGSGTGDADGGEERSPEEENLHDADRPGSEPLRGTHRQHVSGYGGSGNRPKRSSDQREPLDYEGSGGEKSDG